MESQKAAIHLRLGCSWRRPKKMTAHHGPSAQLRASLVEFQRLQLML